MRKFLLTFIGLIAISLTFVAPSFATSPNEVKVLPASETVNHDYFSVGSRSEVNGTVNGDVYVMAGEVIVTGTINGDLLAAGGIMIISGDITGDVRIAGGNVTFSGANIDGNVTAAGGSVTFDSSTKVNGSIVTGAGNLQVFSKIGKGATIGAGNILIANSIGSDVKAGGSNISLTPNAAIKGTLTYFSENKANISEGATVSGAIKHELPKNREVNIKAQKNFEKNAGIALTGIFIAFKIIDTFWLIIAGLLFIYILPNFTKRTADYVTKKLGWAFLAGLAVLIFLPIVGVILMFTVIGFPLAVLLFFVYIFVFWLGRFFAIYALGQFIMVKLGKKDKKGTAYLVGIIIYVLLSLIPIIGFIVSFVISLAGVGALVITKGQVFKEFKKKQLI